MKVATKATVYHLSTGTRASLGAASADGPVEVEESSMPAGLTEVLVRGDVEGGGAVSQRGWDGELAGFVEGVVALDGSGWG